MKHHAKSRPVGKCKGCCLNMRTFCAAGKSPKDEWDEGRCKAFGDKEKLEAFLNPAPATGAKAAKLQRRAKALELRRSSHHNGHLAPHAFVGQR